MHSLTLTLLGLLTYVHGGVVERRQTSANTITVDVATNNGAPKHLVSGIIYGEPDTQNQIPDHFYTDINLNYGRAGGAQLGAPCRGWIWGLNEYKCRFQSTLSNYQTIRKYGGSFVLLPHDIWGTDHANSSTVWPGDNGDFTDYDNFLTQLANDIVANDMLPGLVFDIWNEPNIGIFWNRTQAQWVNLYVNSHKMLRADSRLNPMLISGPTLATQPTESDTWWTSWLSAVSSNNIVPDQYVWHLEAYGSANDDIQINNATFGQMLESRNLPQRQVNINEYGVLAEQVAACIPWYMGRFERFNTIGLRGNWFSGDSLHDFLAGLVGKAGASATVDPAGTYYPNGQWQVYKYYNLNMTGHRVTTTGSGDLLADAYATTDGQLAKVLSGVRLATGTWYITVKNLSALGLPQSGSINIQTWGFPDKGEFAEVDAPTNLGVVAHTYSGNAVTFALYQTDNSTAYAFEMPAGAK